MIDLRPVGYAVGLMVFALGAMMMAPVIVDVAAGDPDWRAFVLSGVITSLVGGAVTLACLRGRGAVLSIEHAFLLTVVAWVALPVFGALPFMMGAPNLRFVDALFEAVSGMTTTGSTIFLNLNQQPPGILLWRALLQWIGGIGIVVFAMIFLPVLSVGGMQLFRLESSDPSEKLFPRVGQLAASLGSIYLGLTLLCAVVYAMLGMTGFDAICHAMTTIATGGFANYDASFEAFPPAVQYAAVVFMLAAALPFIRYIQLASGGKMNLLGDPQVRAFLIVACGVCALLVTAQLAAAEDPSEQTFRSAVFNGVSILTGTGYANANYALWGSFSIAVIFIAGLIGGCAGSTSCSIKVFRYQVLLSLAAVELKRMRHPNGVFSLRYAGRPLRQDVAQSVTIFFFVFFLSLGILTVLLASTGLDALTSVSGAATALANVGPGLGNTIGPRGNFAPLNDTAKYLLVFGMLLGRLELLSVLVLFTPTFWRR
ncbi:MAG: TrkH family potassium uptake protein [Pseudomonadota bacterium]